MNPLKPIRRHLSSIYASLSSQPWVLWRALLLPLLGLAVVLLVGLIFHKSFLIHRAIKCLTLPLIAGIYLSRRTGKPELWLEKPAASPMFWSLGGFMFGAVASINWAPVGIAVGTLAGILMWISPRALWKDLRSGGQGGVMIFIGAISGPLMLIIQRYAWMLATYVSIGLLWPMLQSIEEPLRVVTRLDLFDDNDALAAFAREVGLINQKAIRLQPDFAALVSGERFVQFNSAHNLLTGLFVWPLLLAFAVLKDKDRMAKVNLLKWLGIGAACIVVLNTLFLAFLFGAELAGQAPRGPGLARLLHHLTSVRADPLWGYAAYILIELPLLAWVWRRAHAR